LNAALPRGVGFDGLNDGGNRLLRPQAQQAAEVVWINLELQQVIIVPLTNLGQQRRERLGVRLIGKAGAAAVRAKTEVVMKLVSPGESGERFKLHKPAS
jgi:hypothetical protein